MILIPPVAVFLLDQCLSVFYGTSELSVSFFGVSEFSGKTNFWNMTRPKRNQRVREVNKWHVVQHSGEDGKQDHEVLSGIINGSCCGRQGYLLSTPSHPQWSYPGKKNTQKNNPPKTHKLTGHFMLEDDLEMMWRRLAAERIFATTEEIGLPVTVGDECKAVVYTSQVSVVPKL